MKRDSIKLAIRSFLFHMAYTAISWLFFTIFLSGIRNQMIVDELFVALRWVMFGFSLVIFLIFEFVVAYTYFKNTAAKRMYLSDLEGIEPRGFTRSIQKKNLIESLIMAAPAGLLQLPIALFYTAFGYGYANALGFEKFFVGWIGFYQPWQNAFVGMIINLGLVFLYSYLARILSQKSWERNRIRR